MFDSFNRSHNCSRWTSLLTLGAAALLLAGCSSGTGRKTVAEAEQDLAMKFLPDNCQIIVSVKMDELMDNETFTKLKEQSPESVKNMEDMKKDLGVTPADVSNVTLGLDADMNPIAIVTLKKAVKAEDLLANLDPKVQDKKEEKVGNYTLIMYNHPHLPFTIGADGKRVELKEIKQPEQPLTDALCVVNDKLVIFAPVKMQKGGGEAQTMLRDVLKRDKKPEMPAGLQAALKQTDFTKTIAVAVNVKEFAAKNKEGMPPDLQKSADQVEGVVIHVGLKGDPQIDLLALCKDAKTAEDAKKSATDSIAKFKGMVPPGLKPFLEAIKIESKDAVVSASLQFKPEEVAKAFQDLMPKEKPAPVKREMKKKEMPKKEEKERDQ